MNNLKKPFDFNYNTNRWFPCLGTKKLSRKLFIGKVKVVTDFAMIGKDPKSKTTVKILKELNEDTDRATEDEPYVSIKLFSSKEFKIINRNYEKIVNLLSSVGGISSALLLSISIFYGFYNKISLRLYILNSTILKPYIHKTDNNFTFASIIQFYLYYVLSACFMKKCFSARLRLRAELYFSALEKLNNNLEIKKILANSRDTKIFSSLLLKGWQSRLLKELELKGIINNKDYFTKDLERQIDEEEMDLIEALNCVRNQRGDIFEERVNKFLRRKIAANLDGGSIEKIEKVLYQRELTKNYKILEAEDSMSDDSDSDLSKKSNN